MPDNSAVFNEVIGIKFDTQEFAQSLDELAAIYEQKLSEMSGKGIDLNTAGVAELQSELGALTDTIRAMSEAYIDSFAQMGQAVQSEITQQRELQEALRETDAEAQRVRRTQEGSSGRLFGDFAKGFMGGTDTSFAEMFGQVARFQLLWGGIGLAVQAAMAPVHAIVDGFKEGFEYLTQLEQKSYELTGVLDANVRFSSDLKENFRLASEAAPQVAKALQDVAAATGLKENNLFRSFMALTESGGTGAVHNLQELVQLTELFNLAMRSAGASVETSRLLISQMPNAMSGNISETSKWLEVLHMTKAEWQAMLKQGLEHHDLVQRLQTAMQPYLDATSQAQLNNEELTNKVNLLKERLEATFVAPYFDAYKKFLGDVADLLGVVDAKAAAINQKMTAAANANMSAKHPWMMMLLAAGGLGTAGDTAFPSEASAFAQGPQFDAALDAYADDLLKRSVTAKNKPGSGKPNNDALNALEQDYSLRLRKVKDDTKTTLSDIDSLEREHTISVEDATNRRKAAYAKEREEVDKLVESIQKQLLTVGGKDSSRAKFGKSLNAELGTAANEETRADNKADTQLATEQRATDESALRAALQRARTQADFEIEEAKRSGANHVQIVEMESTADQKMYDLERQLLDKLRQDAGANEKAKQDVQNQTDALEQTRANRTTQRSREMTSAIIANLVHQMDQESAAANADVNSKTQKIEAEKRAGASSAHLKTEQQALSQEYITLLTHEIAQIQGILDLAQALGLEGKEVDELTKKYEKLNAEKDKAVTNATSADPFENPIKDNGTQLSRDLKDFVGLWHEGVHDFGDAVKLVNTGINVFKDAVAGFMQAWSQGKQQGGVLGGIGGVLGEAGSIASMIPGGQLVGGILQAAGSVFGLIGGIFTSAAKHIAEDIKKEFDKTIQELHNGTINLSTAIQQVEQERADAIARLSNKKGGKDQLNQLLPQLDNELASLQQQQKSIFTNFENQLSQLQLQNSVLGSTLKTWQDINKQVQDYLNAGGDAAKAQQFVSLQLQQMQKDAASQLNQANQQAIQDALQLNDLLAQRVNLEKQFAATIFGLQTKDSLERRGSNAITAGIATQQAISDYQKQLSDLNNQIGLTQQKVSLESQIFDINKSTARLQADSNALQIASLNDQLDKIKAYAEIYKGIVQNNGQYTLGSQLAGILGPSSLPVTININGTGGVDPADVADQLSAELSRRGRYGLGTQLVRQY